MLPSRLTDRLHREQQTNCGGAGRVVGSVFELTIDDDLEVLVESELSEPVLSDE